MHKTIAAIAIIAGSLLAPQGFADQLDLTGTESLVDTSAPQRGMSMQRVESKWGQPVRRRAAVGQPPITRWEYEGFVVYFEFDKVIHSVSTQR